MELFLHCISPFPFPLSQARLSSIYLKVRVPTRLQVFFRWFNSLVYRYVPAECRRDPELARRGRLVAHFGVQGTFFGVAYSLFYCAIGHIWGATAIVLCSVVFAYIPQFLRRTGQVRIAGEILVATMAAGFTALAYIEGGIHGHAVAWLASVPLCALLVLGQRSAMRWFLVSFAAGALVASTALVGWHLQPWYDARWGPLVDTAGNLGIIGFLFILGMVFETSRATAYYRMQSSLDDLAASNERLAHLNNEKTEFLGIAAHDLRNPLTAVIGFADMLTMEAESRVSDSGRTIGKAGRRMLDLINDLLDANKIESGQYASKTERIDFSVLVAQSIEHNRLSAERKKIALRFERQTCWVQADRKGALQVLDNLISNAIKYSPPESSVALSIEENGAWVDLRVRDSGPGISERDQKKLFRKHTKLSAKPTAGESSVGLGLSIAKRLTEAMGGMIMCHSILGDGATFVLRLRKA